MRTATGFGVAAVLVLVFALPADAQNIKGDWQLKSCTINGQDVPSEQIEGMQLSMTYAEFEATAGDRKSSGKLDNQNRQQPARLTFTIDSGEDAGRVLYAIYKRMGTELQIVFSRNEEYPSDFESTASNQYAVMNYEYIKTPRTGLSDDERRKRRAPSEIRGMRGG